MTLKEAIIKAGTAAATERVRTKFASRLSEMAALPAEDPAATELTTLRRDVERLSSQLRLRDHEVESHEVALDQAFRDGEAKGRRSGLAEADLREDQRLARLESGIATALETLEAGLNSLERLGAAIALEAVGKILGDPSDRAKVVSQIVRLQVAALKSRQVVSVSIARADFPDTAALEQLAQRMGRASIEVIAVDDLESGDCQIRLKLGALDVGVTQQWSALRSALKDLTEPEAPQ